MDGPPIEEDTAACNGCHGRSPAAADSPFANVPANTARNAATNTANAQRWARITNGDGRTTKHFALLHFVHACFFVCEFRWLLFHSCRCTTRRICEAAVAATAGTANSNIPTKRKPLGAQEHTKRRCERKNGNEKSGGEQKRKKWK